MWTFTHPLVKDVSGIAGFRGRHRGRTGFVGGKETIKTWWWAILT